MAPRKDALDKATTGKIEKLAQGVWRAARTRSSTSPSAPWPT